MYLGIWYRAKVRYPLWYTDSWYRENYRHFKWPKEARIDGRVISWDLENFISDPQLVEGTLNFSYDQLGILLAWDFPSYDAPKIVKKIETTINRTTEYFLTTICGFLKKDSIPDLARGVILVQFWDERGRRISPSLLKKCLNKKAIDVAILKDDKLKGTKRVKAKTLNEIKKEQKNKKFDTCILVSGDHSSVIVHRRLFDPIFIIQPRLLYGVCQIGFRLSQLLKDRRHDLEDLSEKLRGLSKQIGDFKKELGGRSTHLTWLKREWRASRLLFSRFPEFEEKLIESYHQAGEFEDEISDLRDLNDEFWRGIREETKYGFPQKPVAGGTVLDVLNGMRSSPMGEHEVQELMMSYDLFKTNIERDGRQLKEKFEDLKSRVKDLSNILMFVLTAGGVIGGVAAVMISDLLSKLLAVGLIFLVIVFLNWLLVR